MLFIDTQQVSDTSPSVSDILQAADVDSPLNISTAGRFKVLVNKTVMLHDNAPMFHKETYSSMYHHIKYNGSASSDIQRGGLYMLFISDQATNTPTVSIAARLMYIDN